ncbi:MAG TPA: hypothetical protein VFC46_03955, partial [Humisphaera sp.]|nr:hypothetical protein [Humisphaera sp.]
MVFADAEGAGIVELIAGINSFPNAVFESTVVQASRLCPASKNTAGTAVLQIIQNPNCELA